MQEYQEIESPLAAFNNFMINIGKEISNIFGYDLCKNNDIIFDNNSIILFSYVKISKRNDSIQIDFKKSLSSVNKTIYKKIVNNFELLKDIYYRYAFIFDDISKNHDPSISENYIKSILNDIKTNTTKDKLYFIPFRHKIAKDINDDITLKNLYNKFTYALKLTKKKTTNNFKYEIIRLISSDLDESKCIANIRPLEIDSIATGYVLIDDINNFLKDLMFYGKLTNILTTNI